MRIEKIRLEGFKSFAQRTEISFTPGLTAVIGPNGCGKSNIVDALNWVLGTRSAKLVRGEEMTDVVFKGLADNSVYPPARRAEVGLVLSNEGKRFPLPIDQLEVTREITHDGRTTYRLQRIECRQKDIVEQLAGTGLGVGASVVIEQGTVTRLTLADANELRAALDEAAGISSLKKDISGSEERLQKVEQDLIVLAEYIKTLKSKQHSLRIKAARAAKYIELQSEYRDLGATLLATRAEEAFRQLERCVRGRAEKEEQISAVDKELSIVLRELSTARSHLEDCADQAAPAEGRIHERRHEREALESQLQQTTSSHDEAQRRLASQSEQLKEARVRLERVTSEQDELSLSAKEVSKAVRELSKGAERDFDDLGRARKVHSLLKKIEDQAAELSSGLKSRKTNVSRACEGLQDIEKTAHRGTDLADDLVSSLSPVKEEQNSKESPQRILREYERMQKRLGELAATGASLRAEIVRMETLEKDLNQLILESEEKKTPLERKIAKARKEEEKAVQEAAAVRAAKTEASRLVRELEERESLLRSKKEELQTAIQNVSVEQASADSRLKQLAEQGIEEFDRDLEHLKSKAAKVDVLPQLEAQVTQLKAKLSHFGTTEPSSVDELRRVEGELTVKEAAFGDLQSAAAELRRIISALRREGLRLFRETTTRASEEFLHLFTVLFGGGEARIVVVEDESCDPLSLPVEIQVRIPKKDFTRLHLMSGGEKTLTALAFVLSLARLRPAGVCVFDEVDAELDETNSGRLATLLNELKATTQLILITHNKRTMLVADQLYGITMQPQGVSQIVRVDFATGNTPMPHEVASLSRAQS